MMKKTKLTQLSLAIALFAMSFTVSAQIDTPAPSPAGSVTSKLGLTDIEINYSRPQMKGRKIFGAGEDFLIPFGKMWRAGANAGTKVKFSDDVKIEGKDLKAGEYLLFAIPGASDWTITFYSDLTLGGNVGGYDEANEVLRVTSKASKLTETVGTLTFGISDISEDSQTANIQLSWENTAVNIGVTASFDDTIMKAIADNTKVNVRNYLAAAQYYFNTDKDLDQAIAWMEMYLADGENSGQFWNIHLKARMLAKKGDKKSIKAAIAAAEDSLAKAKAFERGDFGYIKRNEELLASLK